MNPPAASSLGVSGPDPQEPLPARMLNEFVYCPRLFYYEHVEGVFAHNADTRRGAALHKRVDAGKGDLPAAKKSGKAAASTETSANVEAGSENAASDSTPEETTDAPPEETPAPSRSPPTASASPPRWT